MRVMCFALWMLWVGCLCLWSTAWAVDTAITDKPVPAANETASSTASSAEVKVSVEAKDFSVKEVLESVAKQSRQKLVLESTVSGTVTSMSLRDVTLEAALGAICKSAKLQWRKIYIAPDSKLLEQPDRLAATVRLVSGLSFPDLVLADSSTNRRCAHFESKNAVASAEQSAGKTLGLTRVYLITNDAAVAAKALAAEKEAKTPTAEKFAQLSKDQMDMFVRMTPEEREQALLASLGLLDQVGPEYTAAVMESLAKIDPEHLRRVVLKQTEMLFSMSAEQRRAMIRLNLEAMKMITPEQQRILQEDAAAVIKELQGEQGN
ncbi:MAG: hypothetical protein ACP5R5_01090 [Armatimonadota bacterium]